MSAADAFPSPSKPWVPGDVDAGKSRWRRSRSETSSDPAAERASGASVLLRSTLGGLSAIAAGLSGYLAWAAFTSSGVAGCGSGAVFDCSHVLTSRWSKVASIPVSVPALLTHFGILALVVARPAAARLEKWRWSLVSYAVMTAAAAAVWFIGLQIFWLQHLCVYCIGAHACALVAFVVLCWNRPLPRKAMAWAGSAAGISLALLVTAQSLIAPPPKFEVIEHGAAPSQPAGGASAVESESKDQSGGVDSGLFEAPTAVSDSPQASAEPAFSRHFAATSPEIVLPHWSSVITAIASPASLLTSQVGAAQQASGGQPPAANGEAGSAQADDANSSEPRLISVLDGIKLNPQHWPIVGDPDAELIFVEILDYTCPHCQATHTAVKGAKQRYGDRLAVLILPVPLNRKCNPTVQNTNAQHAEACELAKLAIAVWRVDRSQFESFHNYLFEAQPNYAQAKARAGQMVDSEKLQAELSSSVPSDYISKHVALYQRAGAGSIPKLMFPGATLVGEVGSANSLVQTIQQRLPGSAN